MRIFNFAWIILLMASGCVSVSLSGDKTVPASGVAFEAPPSPFKKAKNTTDASWLSERTGNSIAYVSACDGKAEVPLTQLESFALASLDTAEVVSSSETLFQGRAARTTTANGSLDGIPMRMSLLVFKKNNCDYTLIYGGVAKQFDSELQYFENFKRNFKVP
ncbi:hypothetical protein BDW_12640 [Bdellovibrio bacteriovorus W]|nr:hypothetical protein BDW_12640 [Bdellovibrio bacteriovorus W]